MIKRAGFEAVERDTVYNLQTSHEGVKVSPEVLTMPCEGAKVVYYCVKATL